MMIRLLGHIFIICTMPTSSAIMEQRTFLLIYYLVLFKMGLSSEKYKLIDINLKKMELIISIVAFLVLLTVALFLFKNNEAVKR